MSAIERLRAALEVITEEAEANPKFAKRLEAALKGSSRRASAARREKSREPNEQRPRASRRRRPALLDPLELFERDPREVRRRLEALDLEALKDIVAEYGMDSTHLAMKWKQQDRLVDLIVQTVEARSRRGDAFRTRSGAVDRPSAHRAEESRLKEHEEPPPITSTGSQGPIAPPEGPAREQLR